MNRIDFNSGDLTILGLVSAHVNPSRNAASKSLAGGLETLGPDRAKRAPMRVAALATAFVGAVGTLGSPDDECSSLSVVGDDYWHVLNFKTLERAYWLLQCYFSKVRALDLLKYSLDCPSCRSNVAHCGGCVEASSCGYCLSTMSCSKGTGLGPLDGSPCPAWIWNEPACPQIPACDMHRNCSSCASSSDCAWCADESVCVTINEALEKNCRRTVRPPPPRHVF